MLQSKPEPLQRLDNRYRTKRNNRTKQTRPERETRMHRLLIAIFLFIACATTPVVAQSDLLEANEAFRLAAQRNLW